MNSEVSEVEHGLLRESLQRRVSTARIRYWTRFCACTGLLWLLAALMSRDEWAAAVVLYVATFVTIFQLIDADLELSSARKALQDDAP